MVPPIIKNKDINNIKFFEKIGAEIGLLFQISDDLIDYKSDVKVAGKPTKRDKIRGKPTLVNLIGYKATLIFANKLKNDIYKKVKKYGIKSKDLLQSVEFILSRKF